MILSKQFLQQLAALVVFPLRRGETIEQRKDAVEALLASQNATWDDIIETSAKEMAEEVN